MSAVKLPGSLHTNRRLSQWLRFDRGGYVEVRTGKVEIGQGILTALAQIAADELDVPFDRVRIIPASTTASPKEGVTSGSLSIQDSGTALRHACAEARALYVQRAAERLRVPVDALEVRGGEIVAPDGARTSYWQLADDALLEREASGAVPPKSANARHTIGTAAARIDLPDKVLGRPRFVQDLELPGLLHGRVLRPASSRARLSRLDVARTEGMKHVRRVVRDGDFVGVVAEREEVAVKAAARLSLDATWSEGPTLPDAGQLADWLSSEPCESSTIGEKREASAAVASTLRARFTRPFIAHASIGPSCAVARWNDGRLEVWSQTQGIHNLQADLAVVFAIPAQDVTVHHVEGAGCYGHNGADDVALDAALLARAVPGSPVRVLWSREDELGWSPFGPAMAVDLEVDLDASGEVLDWRGDVFGNGHGVRPGRSSTPTLLAAAHLAKPFERPIAINQPVATGGGAERNAIPGYDFPAFQLRSHRLLTMPVRTSALRALGAFVNVFAIEGMVDDIAAARGEDPVAWRLRHITDSRGRAVLEAAARRARWGERTKREGTGFGVGYARYKTVGAWCAAIAEIEAEEEIRVRRITLAVDVGLAINPDGVANQVEGGAIQAASWTVREAVGFDRTRITSTSWEEYPILRFSEVPAVDVEVLQQPDAPSVGAGEAAHGPVAAAIGNAVFDALGVRVRDLPITRERLLRL
ncbi:MAG TPA: molybdopterin cofactor-binding domain-containing protein [Usitatibacter sp.]|nr:molybdopterin cofactor-binding domain-containing protein [Usitatibacter sp.]